MTTLTHNPTRGTSAAAPAPRRLKRTLRWLLGALTFPRLTAYRLLRGVIGEERALMWLSESAARATGPLGVLWRAEVYRRVLRHVGRDVFIGFGTLFSKADTQLGDGVYIGRGCIVGWVTIGREARIADGVQLLSGARHHCDAHRVAHTPVTIGERAWIGAGAIVMADVGAGATVGAGAVVTRPVPPGATVVGVPARPIGEMTS